MATPAPWIWCPSRGEAVLSDLPRTRTVSFPVWKLFASLVILVVIPSVRCGVAMPVTKMLGLASGIPFAFSTDPDCCGHSG